LRVAGTAATVVDAVLDDALLRGAWQREQGQHDQH
jgi:hypothetical protein